MRLMIMIMCLLLILLSTFQLMLAFPSVHPTCQSDERSALLQFKESFITDCRYASPLFLFPSAYPKVALWKLEGNGSDCCSWDGVECDVDTGHVIGLNLTASCLYGSIDSNSSLFRLVHLQNLSLAYNNFNGSQIPSALGNLSELRYLALVNSLFSGQIPSEIARLSKLSGLDLSSSYDYPPSERLLKLKMPDLRSLVGNLSSLEFLSLDSVDISSPLPAIFANLSSLRALSLSNCGLIGEFPGTIFQIPNLQDLLLPLNPALTGHLPASIGKFRSIQSLQIDFCNFSGVIPFSLGNLTNLKVLSLVNNSLIGPIPHSIGNLTQLFHLDFSSNELQGSIPISIFALKNLQGLVFFSNNLSGIVDLDLLLTLKNLKVLSLSLNNLVFLDNTSANGTLTEIIALGLGSCSLSAFPLFLRKQNKLEWLNLSINNIRGKIPSWIWTMSLGTLQLLDLSHNYLTGLDQSPTILPWSHLLLLDLSSNLLEGPLPVPPFSTTFYFTTNNSFSGEIPELICKASSLEVLDLSTNNLNGPIPQCLGNFSSSLLILNLESNKLYGTIPQTWSTNNSRLTLISLGQNKLQGQIPRSLANSKMLEMLDLGNNQLNDTFPSWMGTLPELKILMLQHNSFHGKIGSPETSLSFPKLQILDLSTNNFVGKLPVDYFVCWQAMQADVEERLSYLQVLTPVHFRISTLSQNYYSYSIKMTNKGIEMYYRKILQAFKGLDFSCNKFEGEIPEFTGNLKGLRLLNLSNNILSGSIPTSIGNLAKLEALDLSQNKLSREIPQQLVQLTFLEVFNVSHNHLAGRIPRGKQFDTFQNNSFDGNPGLCGEPLSVKCEDPKVLLAAPLPISDESFGLDWKFVLIGYASGFVFGVVIGHLLMERKRVWFMKIFRVRQPRRQRRSRRSRGN